MCIFLVESQMRVSSCFNYKLNYWRILEVEILNYGEKLNAMDYWRKLKGTDGLLNLSKHYRQIYITH